MAYSADFQAKLDRHTARLAKDWRQGTRTRVSRKRLQPPPVTMVRLGNLDPRVLTTDRRQGGYPAAGLAWALALKGV